MPSKRSETDSRWPNKINPASESLHFDQNYFMARAAQAARQSAFPGRPPALAPAQHDERMRAQQAVQSAPPIAARGYMHDRFHAALAGDHAKPPLVPIDSHGGPVERQRIRRYLKRH